MFSFGIIAENFEVFKNNIFELKVLWMVGAGEWNSVCCFLRSVTFAVGFLGRFLGRDVCLWLQRSQGSCVF